MISRSPAGIIPLRTLSSVVLPDDVPPDTSMLHRCSTHARSSATADGVSDRQRIRSSDVTWDVGNLRMVMHGPLTASGSMIAFTRDPSRRRASTSGCDRSIRRPSGATIRSTIDTAAASDGNACGMRAIRPLRST